MHWVLLIPALLGAQPRADLLLVNARVITLNPRQPSAEAVAIRGDRVVWVGSGGGIGAARRLDLGGAVLMPGLIDAHTHLLSLGETFLKLNLKDATTEDEIAARVRERARGVAPGQWILGWGWDEGKWTAQYPTHEKLTAAAPENPVFLSGLHSFAAWVNRQALEKAGVTRETKDPANGRIVRDGTGAPTGILTNQAQSLVARHIPPLTLEQTKRAIALAGDECLRHGLTSVHEARVSRLELQALRELIAEGRLKLRVAAMLDGADPALVEEWLKRGPEIDRKNHRLSVRCFKLFADGALGSRGAALAEPYTDAPETRGVMTTTGPRIYEFTRHAVARGFQVATHAIGDAANRAVLDAYEKALAGRRDARLRIEHAQVLAPDDIARFARLGVMASMQPPHATSDMPWAEKRAGASRIRGAYAWRAVLSTGAHLPLSSDFPGESLDPFHGLYAAITRQDPDGNPPGGWYPDQRLTFDEALRGYTREAAYAEFEEREKGAIEPGMLADFIVVSKDVRAVPPRELLGVRVLKAFVGGLPAPLKTQDSRD